MLMISPSGRLRCGFFTSPARNVMLFQPSYAHNAPSIAAANPPRPPVVIATPSQAPQTLACDRCDQSPPLYKNAPTPTAINTSTLIAVRNVATPPLNVTAAVLMITVKLIAASATSCSRPKETLMYGTVKKV